MEYSINYYAVLVSALATMVIGAVWYSPWLFAKEWMKAVKLSESDMAGTKRDYMVKAYVLCFVAAFVTAYVQARFVDATLSITAADGVRNGFWLWFGFAFGTSVGGVMFERYPWKAFFIHQGFVLATLLVNGAILAVWG